MPGDLCFLFPIMSANNKSPSTLKRSKVRMQIFNLTKQADAIRKKNLPLVISPGQAISIPPKINSLSKANVVLIDIPPSSMKPRPGLSRTQTIHYDIPPKLPTPKPKPPTPYHQLPAPPVVQPRCSYISPFSNGPGPFQPPPMPQTQPAPQTLDMKTLKTLQSLW